MLPILPKACNRAGLVSSRLLYKAAQSCLSPMWIMWVISQNGSIFVMPFLKVGPFPGGLPTVAGLSLELHLVSLTNHVMCKSTFKQPLNKPSSFGFHLSTCTVTLNQCDSCNKEIYKDDVIYHDSYPTKSKAFISS